MLSTSTAELCTAALDEIGVTRAGDTPEAEALDFVLTKLNRLLDNLNAEEAGIYAESFTTYVLTANRQPHTIGPTGNWIVTSRPPRILGANLVLTTVTPNVRQAVTLRDKAWWLAQSVRTQTSAYPTDLYYDDAWPNGNVNLWPVPTAASSLELLTQIVLANLALADTFSMPPGYYDAVTLTLAEDCAAPFGQPLTTKTMQNAAKARARVFGKNTSAPVRLVTRDAGMPRGGRRGGFNYLTRKIG